ncbi:hypothetical protein B4Q13_20215, partial [Lacticaseibacillus rhamnosus]
LRAPRQRPLSVRRRRYFRIRSARFLTPGPVCLSLSQHGEQEFACGLVPAGAKEIAQRSHDAAGVKKGNEMFDYLIIGAGFAGSVLAERLARNVCGGRHVANYRALGNARDAFICRRSDIGRELCDRTACPRGSWSPETR